MQDVFSRSSCINAMLVSEGEYSEWRGRPRRNWLDNVKEWI